MAKTHVKASLGSNVLNHPSLSGWALWEPEGASQTFTRGAPVIFSSGLLIAATDPISSDDNDLHGVAVEDGHNASAGVTNLCKFVPAIDGVIFYGNAVTGDGADYVLTAADLFAAAGNAVSSKSGFATTSVTDWFVDVADTNGATIVSFKSDFALANQAETRAEVGDTNARVGFIFIDSVRLYD